MTDNAAAATPAPDHNRPPRRDDRGDRGKRDGRDQRGGGDNRGASGASGGRENRDGARDAGRGPNRGPHPGGGRGDDRRRRDDRADKPRTETRSASPSRRGPDPDSPFAALSALKAQLEKQSKERS